MSTAEAPHATISLAGRTALVVGVTPGNLGFVIAQRLSRAGAAVMISGRRDDATAEAGRQLDAATAVADIAEEAAAPRLVETAVGTLGGIDIAVNATGWGLLKPFEETTREDLDRMAAVQFVGPFQLMQALVRVMARPAGRGGSIIQISSVTATIMFENHAAYMGTKAGFDHVIRCIANEYGGRGIRANSISPGGIQDTPMSGGGLHHPAVAALYRREIPLDRPGVAADIADAALWLAGDMSGFVTGQNIQVSGGQTLRRNPSIAEVYRGFGA